MSKKYLDNNGLSYFWGKINTKLNNKVDSTVEMTDQYNHDYTGTIENTGNTIKLKVDTDYTITDTYLECADTSISMVSTNGNYVGGISANAFEPQMISQYTHDNTIDYAGIYSKSNGPVIEYYKSGTIKGKLQIDTDGTKLSGVVTPTTNDMAANKSYVDTAVSSKVSSSTITNIVTCTTAEYNASSKDSNTIYLLTD